MHLKKIKHTILRGLGNVFLYSAINLLCRTLKIQTNIPTSTKALLDNNQPCVFAFWHGTMLIPWYIHRNHSVAALVSPSKDGEILTRILEKWKYVLHRGSSNESGKEALNTLIETAKNNVSVALTPDGPKGPAKEFKAGAVIVAKKGGLPLILVSVKNKNMYMLKKSWDSFEIPKFFSDVFVYYSEPITIKSNISYEETSKFIEYCGNKLNELQVAEN